MKPLLYNAKGELMRADSWYNPITGYGGSDDPIQNTHYVPDSTLPYYRLEAMYEGNWVVTKGVDIPVDDRLGDGIEFLTNDDDTEGRRKKIEEIETEFQELMLCDHQILATKWERLYGGALMYFDYGDGSDNQRFELRESQRGRPAKVWTVDRWRATPVSYYTEFIHGTDHPKLGEVEVYNVTLQTTGWSKVVMAHESRCIKFGGLPLPPYRLAANLMWGNSVVQPVHDIVRQFGVSLKAMADTLEDFNWKSLMIENLADIIANNPDAWTADVALQTAMAAKNYHNHSIGIHGSNTELTKHSTTVTGLTDMVELFSNFVAAAWGIPDSKFFSAKGGALAGTSAQSDERHYHKRLEREQKALDTPRIQRQLWLLGYDPAEYPFKFPPLETPTEKENLETDKLQAEIDAIYITNQVVAPEEVAISRFSKVEPTRRQWIIDFENREDMTPDEDGDTGEDEEMEDDQRADVDEEGVIYLDFEEA
jgi:phage-related protein (TIGR01555 family)